MVLRVRYSLLTKTIQSPDTSGGGVPNPALQRRSGNIELDEGRPWGGDVYDEGAVTSPEEAYAHFQTGEDTEAWLDRADDGTLVGWVREGDAIYRYIDPEAWALDVDGAGMQRIDGGATPEGMVPGEDPAPTEGDQPADETGAEPGAEEPGEEETPSIGETAPDAFAEEEDPATEEGDPTDALEDPTDLPEGEDNGGEDAEDAFADMIADDSHPDEADEVNADPSNDLVTDEPDPADAPADPETEPEAAADETVTLTPEQVEADLAASAPAENEPSDEPAEAVEPAEGDEDEDEKKNPFEKKHLPGEHNQETHGRRYGVSVTPPRSHRSGSGSGSADPKVGEPPKAALNAKTVSSMTNEELETILDSAESFDLDTLLAAADELDRRDDLDGRVRDDAGDAAPGSPEESAAFDTVIPRDWATWAGSKGKAAKSKSQKRAEVESAWMDYWLNLQHRANEVTNGANVQSAKKLAFDKAGLSEDDFFNGGFSKAEIRRWGSEELRAFLQQNALTKMQWLAEFYPSYYKRLKQLGFNPVSEYW